MAESLDMSLDAIIEKNKKSGGGRGSSNFPRARGRGGGSGGRGQGRGGRDISGPGPVRRFPNRVQTRTPYFTPQAVHQMQELLVAAGGSDTDSETKLYISNLDYGVTNDDIKIV